MSEAFSNRVLAEYYDIVKKYGPEAADQIYDVYNTVGRFDGGVSTLDRLTDLANSAPAKKAGQYLDEAAVPILNLADKIPMGKGGQTATRFAGSRLGQVLGKALPVLGAVTAVTDVGDIITNDTSAGNKLMDTAAMGIGGAIGGIVSAGNPFVAAGGASLGKMGSDALQWLFGDKRSAKEKELEKALALLGGRN